MFSSFFKYDYRLTALSAILTSQYILPSIVFPMMCGPAGHQSFLWRFFFFFSPLFCDDPDLVYVTSNCIANIAAVYLLYSSYPDVCRLAHLSIRFLTLDTNCLFGTHALLVLMHLMGLFCYIAMNCISACILLELFVVVLDLIFCCMCYMSKRKHDELFIQCRNGYLQYIEHIQRREEKKEEQERNTTNNNKQMRYSFSNHLILN